LLASSRGRVSPLPAQVNFHRGSIPANRSTTWVTTRVFRPGGSGGPARPRTTSRCSACDLPAPRRSHHRPGTVAAIPTHRAAAATPAEEIGRHCFVDRSADAVHDYLSSIFPAGESEEAARTTASSVRSTSMACRRPTRSAFRASRHQARFTPARSERPWFPPGPGDRAKPPDTVARCRRFGLAGGSRVRRGALDHRTGHRTDMRDRAVRATIEQLRHALARHRDIEVDERHRYIVRTRSGSGPIPKDLAREIGSSVDGLLRIVAWRRPDRLCTRRCRARAPDRALARPRGRVVLAVRFHRGLDDVRRGRPRLCATEASGHGVYLLCRPPCGRTPPCPYRRQLPRLTSSAAVRFCIRASQATQSSGTRRS
jgi:hypothetical protein